MDKIKEDFDKCKSEIERWHYAIQMTSTFYFSNILHLFPLK